MTSSIETYFRNLLWSEMPLSNLALLLIWILVFTVNILLIKGYNKALASQACITFEKEPETLHLKTWKIVCSQGLMTGLIFALAELSNDALLASLYMGGWVMAGAVGLGLNFRARYWISALQMQEDKFGKLTLSDWVVQRDLAAQFFASAITCLVVGIVLCHLAPMGAALFLGATGIGYFIKARSRRKT